MTTSSADLPLQADEILTALPEPLLVLDAGGRVQRASDAFHRVFATSPAAVLGTPVTDVAGGAWDDPTLRERIRRVFEEGASFEPVVIEDTFPGAGRRVMRLNGAAVQEDGWRGLLLIFEDLTEQRQLEEELREHAARLKRSNADLEQFAYAASHDLQEPLRMVSSYLQLLERRYGDDLPDEAREFMEYAVDGSRRMKALINGLLAYSRVGRKEGEFGPVDLDAVLDDVLDDLERKIEETGASISREDLPRVHGNADQLARVIQNLVENALLHGGDGPPRISVAALPEPEDAEAHVVVRDRGPGIPPEASERIFQLFQQLDPHGRGRQGSGMGLALSRKIVERHGGRIWVESEPGEGSAFHFTLSLPPEASS